MSAALLLLLLRLLVLSPCSVFSYNIDVAHPMIYTDPSPGQTDYFGYSVSLSSRRSSTSPSSLFVGAPNATAGQGMVYRCKESETGGRRTSGCHSLELANTGGTTPGWLGASMATDEFTDLTVCGPRSLFKYKNDPVFKSLGGTCYIVKDAIGDVLQADYGYVLPYGGLNILNGFSVFYAARNNTGLNQGSTKITGQPGVQSVNIKQGSSRSNKWFYERDPNGQSYYNYFGYSVSAGYYFGSNELRMAVGAPAWSRKGMAVIFKQRNIRSGGIKMVGSVPGEYFGASLATGDFDGDGRDDLAIGAPHWGDINFGRVYTYHGNNYGMKLGRTLKGKVGNGQFGYTLASGDLDLDGYSDLIVSAPWENSGEGAVYVYYGHRNFRDGSPSDQIIQRIEPSAFGSDHRIQRFGFSLSRPVDIDGNGYPDLGIGAYKSGHAVVLRSRSVIGTKIEIESNPATLQTSDDHFTVSVCVTYGGTEAPRSQSLSFDMTVDARYNRAGNGTTQKFDGTFQRGRRDCVRRRIDLVTSEKRNNVDPIMIDVTHSIKEGVDQEKIDPVLDRRSLGSRTSLTVPINTKCRNFIACHAELYVDAKFGDLREDNVWVVGSGDISLSLTVRNEDEPAYNTQITIELPAAGIRPRNPIESCRTAPDTLSLACDVGNPLVKGKPVSFKVDFDMSEIDTKFSGDAVLFFTVTKSTRSIDGRAKDSLTILKLNTKHLFYLTLTGVSDKKHINYRRVAEDTKLPIRHVYQVRKSGPSPIAEAYLTIDVPTSIFGQNDSFVDISDPKLTDSYGVTQNCEISDSRSTVDYLVWRKRGEDSKDGDETLVTRPTPNIDSDEETVLDGTTKRTVYLNCSTEGISCTRLTCGLHFPKGHESVANMILDMTLNATAFKTPDEDSFTVKIQTNASVDIKWPVLTPYSNWTDSVTTMLHSIPEPKRLAGSILPVSIFFGILLFCIVAIILFKVGFFNRSQKLKTAKARDKELILDTNDAENIEYVYPDVNAIGNGED